MGGKTGTGPFLNEIGGNGIALKIFAFTLIAFFGALSLLPFYIGEEILFERTIFSKEFFMWIIFAAISPGIIAFTLYTLAQKSLGASLTGFTLYVFTIYGAVYGYFLFGETLENYHFIGTALVFIDDGVFQCIDNQAPEGRKNIEKTLKSLPLFDIDELYILNSSLKERGIANHNKSENTFCLTDSLNFKIIKCEFSTFGL